MGAEARSVPSIGFDGCGEVRTCCGGVGGSTVVCGTVSGRRLT